MSHIPRRLPARRLLPAVMLIALGVLVVAAGCRGSAGDEPRATPIPEQELRRIVREEVSRLLAGSADATPAATCDVATAAARALPSVLQVEARRPGTQVITGRGSGFVALAGGIVVTAAHVLNGPADVTIVTSDGRRMAAELLKSDATLDLAVLRAADRRLPAVRWADTASVVLGEPVRIAGFPFGRPDVTVTGGVLSRRIASSAGGREELVTDADADPGNSGGPLLTACGEALGVVVQREISSALTTRAVGAATALPFVLAAAAAPVAQSTATPIATRTP